MIRIKPVTDFQAAGILRKRLIKLTGGLGKQWPYYLLKIPGKKSQFQVDHKDSNYLFRSQARKHNSIP